MSEGSPEWGKGRKATHVDRAAQFMPFAALTGYYDLVRAQESVVEPRHDLSAEDVERISSELSRVHKGDLVRVKHYTDGSYVTQEGIVSRLDVASHELQVVRTCIRFEDVWRIEAL